MYPRSITDYFTPQSLNPGGGVTMLAHETVDRKTLYLTNQNGQKLLKLSLKNKPATNGDARHAQIKLIPYGIKRAWVWRDHPSDPHIAILRDGVDLTYHGGRKADEAPKVHLKASTLYTNLIDDSLSLPNDTAHAVPLFSLETGYSNQWPPSNPVVTKSDHVVYAAHPQPVRFDLYLASADMDMSAFVNSMYFFNLFWTQDYLATTKCAPLTSGLIIAPITFYRMGMYQLAVRRSISRYNGRARLHFYNNKNYYEKLMNRPTVTANTDGTFNWSTMALEEDRLQAEVSGQDNGAYR